MTAVPRRGISRPGEIRMRPVRAVDVDLGERVVEVERDAVDQMELVLAVDVDVAAAHDHDHSI